MINAISDSSDSPVTAPKPLLSLPQTARDQQLSPSSDSSDRKSLVPAPCARKTFNARNPLIGHCCHCGHSTTHTGSTP